MRSDWTIPICTGPERIKINGKKAHPTQKPEALLYRIIQGSTKPDDLILDPFFGTGTSGAVAKRLHRHFLGIEKDDEYIKIARKRISEINSTPYDAETFDIPQPSRRGPRISTGMLLEKGFLQPGQAIYFRKNDKHVAKLRSDGHLILDGFVGSIHQAGRHLLGGVPCNGWDLWCYKDELGKYRSIDELRKQYRALIK
jgi:modification methylase